MTMLEARVQTQAWQVAERIAPYAGLDVAQAHAWMAQTRGRVKALLPTEVHAGVDAVELVHSGPETSPYGWCLGSWIDFEAGRYVLRAIPNWAVPMSFSLVHLPESMLAERGQRIVAARLRIGVTNDLWQPFVRGPAAPAVYSMIRHHALMLAGAWSWLGPEERALWSDVLQASVLRARELWSKHASLDALCDELDQQAAALWRSERPVIQQPQLPDPAGDDWRTIADVMARFSLAGNVAVAALVRRLQEDGEERWPEQLMAWAKELTDPDFNRLQMDRLWRAGA